MIRRVARMHTCHKARRDCALEARVSWHVAYVRILYDCMCVWMYTCIYVYTYIVSFYMIV